MNFSEETRRFFPDRESRDRVLAEISAYLRSEVKPLCRSYDESAAMTTERNEDSQAPTVEQLLREAAAAHRVPGRGWATFQDLVPDKDDPRKQPLDVALTFDSFPFEGFHLAVQNRGGDEPMVRTLAARFERFLEAYGRDKPYEEQGEVLRHWIVRLGQGVKGFVNAPVFTSVVSGIAGGVFGAIATNYFTNK